MSKKKTIESEELIRLLDEYRLDNPGMKLTIPKFGTYIRNKGVEVPDYTIRRDQKFREYLDAVNHDSEEDIYNDLVTYKTIDVDTFLTKNNTKTKLKEAISIRDRYYANIAARAAEAIKIRTNAEERIKELESRVSELESKLVDVQAKADNADIRKKNAAIARLKAILDSYVYPDAANAILKEDGILEVINSVVPDEIMKNKTIHADTEVKASKYNSVNKLLGGFDD